MKPMAQTMVRPSTAGQLKDRDSRNAITSSTGSVHRTSSVNSEQNRSNGSKVSDRVVVKQRDNSAVNNYYTQNKPLSAI